ncbi:MAG: PIN domain-containing protein [Defluviitaleaceae bacterium]|nr:PIN domain-containing protein [Defluviitaleaceae bacterium]
MHKLKLYLDTSAISHLYQLDAPDKMSDTLALWKYIISDEYYAVISEVTARELMNAPEPKRSIIADYLNQANFKMLSVTSEVNELAQEIIRRGILTLKSFDDCMHIATAILSNCDIIVSWNFKHLVNIKTINGVREIVVSRYYKPIDIYTPTVLLKGDESHG